MMDKYAAEEAAAAAAPELEKPPRFIGGITGHHTDCRNFVTDVAHMEINISFTGDYLKVPAYEAAILGAVNEALEKLRNEGETDNGN